MSTDDAGDHVMNGNPVEPQQSLVRPQVDHTEHPQHEILPGDSATTRAEKIERTANGNHESTAGVEDGARKRIKLDHDTSGPTQQSGERIKGIASIKKEYLVDASKQEPVNHYDEDAAEASGKTNGEVTSTKKGGKGNRGQNTSRKFGSSRDAIQLCKSRDHANEFDEVVCKFGDKCRSEHNIRKYVKDGKREDLFTFGSKCPVKESTGSCPAGWRCRFAGSHSEEVKRDDGRMELIDLSQEGKSAPEEDVQDDGVDIVNKVSNGKKIELRKRQVPMPKSEQYLKWLTDMYNGEQKEEDQEDDAKARRAAYTDPPLRPSEKRRIYYGHETPILAPLTTQGNLPFRRLCVELGAQVTWSEMAMGIPLLQGEKSEWALLKAHESETASPRYTPKSVIQGYDNAKDLKFGAQIAGNKPWVAVKTTEVLTTLCPNLRAIDLNCGCPIDLLYRQGAGSALLDSPGKMEKILRGMNLVSGEVPITVKIRMGTKDKHPTAEKLCQRLIMGGYESQSPAGIAAIALHGRSRQQRYTRSADWEYIAECASLVDKLREEQARVTDTIRESDARDQSASGTGGLPYFIGNGDVLTHTDYNEHFDQAKVDGVMIGRGALIKPWVFEEIQAGQYLDKSSSERLQYVEKFCRNGLEYWGSDEIGVGNTRRFLLEWLSFSYRYVPVGLLEHLPPRLGDRPPAFRGRDELETLMASANYKDWIKISEMFLGKAHENFHFEPKHKSNSYEIEAEG